LRIHGVELAAANTACALSRPQPLAFGGRLSGKLAEVGEVGHGVRR